MAEPIVGLEIKFHASGADQVNAEWAKVIKFIEPWKQGMASAMGGITEKSAFESAKRVKHAEDEGKKKVDAHAKAAKQIDNLNKQHLEGFRTYQQLEAQYHGVKTKQLIEDTSKLVTEKVKAHQDMLHAATRAAADEARLREKNVAEEIRSMRDLARQREEVMHHGAGALIGQLGLGREITEFLNIGAGGAVSIASVAGAALGAIGGIEGIKELAKSGIEALKVTENLKTAFESAGVAEANMNRQMAESDRLATELSQRWNVFSDRTRQVETYIAQMGRVTGQQNTEITKMSIAVEQATKDFGEAAISAEQFSKIFNVSDPEREVFLGRLKLKYRDLADALEHVKTTAEALTIAHQYLQPVMVAVEERARGSEDAWDRAGNSAKEYWRTISQPVGKGSAYLLEILRSGPGATHFPWIEKATEQTKEFKQRLEEISKFRHIDIDIDVAVKMTSAAYEQLKFIEQHYEEIYGKAVDIPDLVQPTIQKAKSIEEVNRDHFAKEREQYDQAASTRLNQIHIAQNDQLMSERQAKMTEIRVNIDLYTELARITEGKKGLAKEHREFIEHELALESDARKTYRDFLKADLEEYKQLYVEGVSFIKYTDDTTHADRLAALDSDYDTRKLKEKQYQHAILEENLRFAKERLNNAGGDEKLVAEAKMQVHQAQHALNLERIHTEDELENQRRERQYQAETKHWQDMKEITDAGISSVIKPLNDGIERNINLLGKDGNAFKQWGAGILNVFAKIGEKKLEQWLEDTVLGAKPEKQGAVDNTGKSANLPASLELGAAALRPASINDMLLKLLPQYGDTPDTLANSGAYHIGGDQYALIGKGSDMLVSIADNPIFSTANVFKAPKTARTDTDATYFSQSGASKKGKQIDDDNAEAARIAKEDAKEWAAYRREVRSSARRATTISDSIKSQGGLLQEAKETLTDAPIAAKAYAGGLASPAAHVANLFHPGAYEAYKDFMLDQSNPNMSATNKLLYGYGTYAPLVIGAGNFAEHAAEHGVVKALPHLGKELGSHFGLDFASEYRSQQYEEAQKSNEGKGGEDLAHKYKDTADSLKDLTQGAKLANAGLQMFGKNGLTGNKDIHKGASMASSLLGLASMIPGIGEGASILKLAGAGLGLFDSGGYTGDGDPRKPAGIVHKGEYVLTAAETRALRSRRPISVNEPAYMSHSNSGSSGGTTRWHDDDLRKLAGYMAEANRSLPAPVAQVKDIHDAGIKYAGRTSNLTIG